MHHLQNEEWLSWLTVLSCWHHKILVVTSDWIAFLCGFCTGSLYCAKYCVFTAIWQKRSFGTVPVVSRVKAYLEWIWCTGILIEYHMYIPILTWPGMQSSVTSHGSVNDITQHVSLNSFLVLSFDTKMSHLKRRWKFHPYLNWFFFQEDSITGNISMGICSSQFHKKYYYIWCIKWCKC